MSFLARWWWVLLLGPIVGALPATVLAERATPFFESETTVFVVGERGSGASERLTNTYADLVELRPVLAEVIGLLSLDLTVEELDEKITATAQLDRQLILISVRDVSPGRAASIANTTAAAFIRQANAFLAAPAADNGVEPGLPPGEVAAPPLAPSELRVVEGAIPNPEAIRPNVALNSALAAALGLLVAASISIGLDSLQRGVRPEGSDGDNSRPF